MFLNFSFGHNLDSTGNISTYVKAFADLTKGALAKKLTTLVSLINVINSFKRLESLKSKDLPL